MCILFFLPLRSIPIQSRVENIVTAFCHNYSTRLSLLLLPRLRISFSILCTTCSSIFLLYIHSIYILFFSPFDPNSIDREFDRFCGLSLLSQLFHSIIIIIVIIIIIATFRTKYPFPCYLVLRVHDPYPLSVSTRHPTSLDTRREGVGRRKRTRKSGQTLEPRSLRS